MITITIPLKKEFIIALLDQRKEQDQTFKFVRQDKMKLYFEVNGNQQMAVEKAKKIIQSSSLGKALFFNVTYEE